uniref:N-acetyltransferase domain-containing protein n=1 Tax=Ditylenchus dipsaci TaxID=166011 RepID=A0A915CX67_9BILA
MAFEGNGLVPSQMIFTIMKHLEKNEVGVKKDANVGPIKLFLENTHLQEYIPKVNQILPTANEIICYKPGTREIAGFLLYKDATAPSDNNLLKIRLPFVGVDKKGIQDGIGRQLIEYFLKFWNEKRESKKLVVKSVLHLDKDKHIVGLLEKCNFKKK